MIREFYHVVTNCPMKVGQKIEFNDNYHSDVYKRVYELEDKVKEIYLNPNKFKDFELDHNLKVALREMAMEEVRKNKYPNYPSRLESLYASNTLEEAERWYELFIEWGRPTCQIVKISVDGNVFVGDAWNCFDGTIDREVNLKLAENYWKCEKNKKNNIPIIEILVDGIITVIDIVKVNNNMN